MKKKSFTSILIPLIIIPVGGILILGVCYLLYGVIYNLVETAFFPHNPTLVPAGIIRNSYSVALIALFLALMRTKLSDLLKSIILIGPLTTLIIAAILAFHEQPILAIAATVVIAVVCMFLIYKYKKPWIYYYATAITVLAGIFYAWPRG
jgi:hypothetical protein